MDKRVTGCGQGTTSFGKDEVLAGVFYFALFVFIYGFLIFRFGMHPDEVLDYDGHALGTYVGGGRWVLGLWREVFGAGYLPYASGLIAGVLISVALVLQTRLLGIRSAFHRVVYGCMYMGCIQFAWMLQYSHQADAVAFGFLLSTLCVGFLVARKPRCIPAILCATLALAVYQTNILYIVVLYFACMLSAPSMPRLRRVAACACCLVAALVLWKISVYVSWCFPWVSESQISYQVEYQKTLNQWVRFGELTPFRKCKYIVYFILVSARNLIGLAYKGQWVYATALLPFLYLVRCYLRENARKTACIKTVLLVGVWFLPFIFPVIMGTDQGPRTNVAEPLACALIWGMAVCRFRPHFNQNAGKVLAVLLVLVVFKSAVDVSVYARDEARNFRDGVADLRSMELCGLMVAGNAGAPVERILLFGPVPEVDDPQTALQAKAQCLHSGTTTWYLSYLRSPFLKVAREEDFAKHQRALEHMPAWPAAGSVRLDEGEVIIRVEPSELHPVPDTTVRERESYMEIFRL